VKLYDTIEIDKDSFCTVLEYCEGDDLSIFIKKNGKISEKIAKLIIYQLIAAINYLNS
jgi:tousled-like kinase